MHHHAGQIFAQLLQLFLFTDVTKDQQTAYCLPRLIQDRRTKEGGETRDRCLLLRRGPAAPWYLHDTLERACGIILQPSRPVHQLVFRHPQQIRQRSRVGFCQLNNCRTHQLFPAQFGKERHLRIGDDHAAGVVQHQNALLRRVDDRL